MCEYSYTDKEIRETVRERDGERTEVKLNKKNKRKRVRQQQGDADGLNVRRLSNINSASRHSTVSADPSPSFFYSAPFLFVFLPVSSFSATKPIRL